MKNNDEWDVGDYTIIETVCLEEDVGIYVGRYKKNNTLKTIKAFFGGDEDV
jgi:hypothetical protein